MARFTQPTTGDGSGIAGPQGDPGAPGADGADGTNALWNYTGEYSGGAAYAVGDIATYDGQLWYRYNSNGGNVGDTPSPGLWNLLAAKGADGADGADGATGSQGLYYLGNYVSGNGYVANLAVVKGSDNNLYIATSSGGLGDPVGNTAEWSIFLPKGADGSGGTADTGDITFDGIQIIGAGTASGDGNDLGTIELVPDGNITSDQYVIIDPTSPNHIHLRAGGVQDNSSAHIFLGGERNNIEVSDPYRTVKISTKPDGAENTYGNSNEASNTEFVHASSADIQSGDTVRLYTGGPTYVVDNVTQEYPSAGFITVTAPGLSFITGEAYVFTRDQGYNNEWTFGNDGVLSGPAMGGIWVESIQKKSVEYGLGIYSPVDIVLEASNGEFLNDSSNPDNQIATIGDLPTTANDSWTVATGTATYSFTLPSSGTYVMWVEGNIPNGIISWNATVSVTNANVPAIGSQYAWNYTGGGSPILLTAIPNQIRGVAGTINTDNTYVGNTSNRFDFTIANTSGASRTVYYGYTKI